MIGFILDVDGVVTNDRSEMNLELLEKVSKLNAVFVTGRTTKWIQEHVFPVKKLDNVFMCECGNVMMKGDEIQVFEKLPVEAFERMRKACEGLEGVWFDVDKKSMVSIEYRHELSPEIVKRDFAIAEAEMKKVGEEFGLDFTRTTTAADLIYPGKNKDNGVKKALEYLKADEYVAMGDSPNDFLMIDGLEAAGKKYTFYYVGKFEIPEDKKNKVVVTKAKYDLGALEALSQYTC